MRDLRGDLRRGARGSGDRRAGSERARSRSSACGRARSCTRRTDARGRTTLRLLESVRDFAREMSDGAGARGQALARATRGGGRRSLRASRRCGQLRKGHTRGARGTARGSGRGIEATRRLDGARDAGARGAARDIGTTERCARERRCRAYTREGAVDDAARASQGDGLALPKRHSVLLGRVCAWPKGTRCGQSAGSTTRANACSLAVAFADDLGATCPKRELVGAEARRVLGSVLRAWARSTRRSRTRGGPRDVSCARRPCARGHLPRRDRRGVPERRTTRAARGCHAEAIAIHVATGSRRAEGVERSYLAVATHRRGDPAASIALHEQALAIHREVGHRRLEGAEVLHLGFVHHEMGALEQGAGIVRDGAHAPRGGRRAWSRSDCTGLRGAARSGRGRRHERAAQVGRGRSGRAGELAPRGGDAPPRRGASRDGDGSAGARVRILRGVACDEPRRGGRLRGADAARIWRSRSLARRHRRGRIQQRSRAHIAEASARVARLENPHLRVALDVLAAAACGRDAPDVPAAASAASSEVRRALALSGVQRALVIERDGKRAVLPDGRAVDLSRRKNVRLVLVALARARRDAPGTIVSAEALLEAGWAGERMRPDAATKRLHTAIWTLRSLGFEAPGVDRGGWLFAGSADKSGTGGRLSRV